MLQTENQALQQDAIVTLFEIDAGADNGGTLRFSPEAVDGGSAYLGGYEYVPLPIAADGFEWSSQGQLPRPTMQVSALSLSFLSLVISADDLIGLPIRRIRTYRRHLDDGDDPDDTALFPTDHYVFQQKTRQTATTLEFQLAVELDQQGKQIPARQVLRDSCTHVYRTWNSANRAFDYRGVTCPYTLSRSFDRTGARVAENEDQCGKRVSDCERRCGAQFGALYTRAFPGVGRTR